MKLSKAIKPISYLKSNTSTLVQDVFDNHDTVIITQKGQAKVVMQDIRVYEQMQESLAMLKILLLSSGHLREGKVKPARQAFADVRKKISEAAKK